jgi:hypothetical protein
MTVPPWATGHGGVGGRARPHDRLRSGPARGGCAPSALPTVERFCTVLLCGRAGRLTAQHGGFRPPWAVFRGELHAGPDFGWHVASLRL